MSPSQGQLRKLVLAGANWPVHSLGRKGAKVQDSKGAGGERIVAGKLFLVETANLYFCYNKVPVLEKAS